ncbi:hypothetical protein TSAR_010097 [Trichomalopsis sarcophagae]|uniref:Ionotropic glutamate receptor C-terminal domain-containing protein n=1 Tax=Trichomalopsis sarcophagae TaxID=543379 RepID=A0A232FFG0_9HYME|nr:hypothetical protein TSAR_010097 [Trichomalopsis sarcophagae]
MWKIAWFMVIICCVSRVTSVLEIDSIVVELVKNLDYEQLVVFKNSEYFFRNSGLKIVKLMEQTKTILVDIDHEQIYSLSLGISRTSTLCIILQNEAIGANDVMRFLVEASPVSTRPKCLMFADNDTYSEESFASILLQAWSLKFLDFTILFVNDEGQPQMISYNPFTKSYITEEVTNTSLLFPDKMSNMNEYTLRIPIYYLPPYNSFVLQDGAIASVDGYDYPFIEIFSKKLNFSLQYLIVEERSNITALFEKLLLLLENNKVSILPKPLYLGTHYYGRDVVIGKAYRDTNYVLIVPVLPMSRMRDYMWMLTKLAFFPTYVLILKLILSLMRFRLNQWIHLLQMLVGSTLTKQPQKVAERIVFFTVVLLSMIFSTDVLASLTDTKVASNDIPFESYEEIISSNLKVYGRITGSERQNDLFKKLDVQNIKSLSECISKSARTKCCICIAPKLAAMYLVDEFENKSEPTLKISRFKLYSDMLAFGFEKASPYVEKIDLVLQTLVEAGVQSAWKTRQSYSTVKDRKERDKRRNQKEDSSEKIVVRFTAMLLVFHVIATVVFLVELLTKRFGPRVRRMFVTT